MKEYLSEYLIRKSWDDDDAHDIEDVYYGAHVYVVEPTELGLHDIRHFAVKKFVEKKQWHICDQCGAVNDVRDWYDQENSRIYTETSRRFYSPIEYAEI